MMKKGLVALIATQLLCAEVGAASYNNAALKAGSLGAGLDISNMINEKVALRANINGLRINRSEELDDIAYDATLTLLTVGVLADYYPFENSFRLSGGLYYNGNKLEGAARPVTGETIDLGNNNYVGVDEVGRVDVEIDFDKIAPYLGVGWGNKPTSGGWGFTFDLGLMYQGSPNVYANAVPNASLSQSDKEQIAADVEKERKKIEDDVSSFEWYPVLMVGVNYTF